MISASCGTMDVATWVLLALRHSAPQKVPNTSVNCEVWLLCSSALTTSDVTVRFVTFSFFFWYSGSIYIYLYVYKHKIMFIYFSRRDQWFLTSFQTAQPWARTTACTGPRKERPVIALCRLENLCVLRHR